MHAHLFLEYKFHDCLSFMGELLLFAFYVFRQKYLNDIEIRVLIYEYS